MKNKKYKFDHTNKTFHGAIGFSKDEMNELLAQSKKIFRNIDKKKKSVAVEEISNIIDGMNQREISVVIFLLLDYIHYRISGTLIDKIVKMAEMDDMPLPPKLHDDKSDDEFNPSYM